MLGTALVFIQNKLEVFFREKLTIPSSIREVILLTGLTKPDGSAVNDNAYVYATLTHLEEERIENKKPVYRKNVVTGKIVQLEPPLRLNAYVLFSSVRKEYVEELNDISLTALFFQSHNVFTKEKYPEINNMPDIQPWQKVEEITMQLCSLSYEQQSYIWSYLGSKYRPCLLYKMRLLIVFNEDSENQYAPILEGVANSNPN